MSLDLDEKELSRYAMFPIALYESDKPELIPKGYMKDRQRLLYNSLNAEAVYVNDEKREVVWTISGTRIKPILKTDRGTLTDLSQDLFIAVGGLTGYFGLYGLITTVGDDLVEEFKELYQKYYANKREPYKLIMSSHSLGASLQQLLMLQLLKNENLKTMSREFIKNVYGFNLGLSPIDVIKFYTGLHYVSPEDREIWEDRNHLIIVQGDIISSRFGNPETFDSALPQHVQVIQPKANFNKHTILNFLTEGDLKEVEKISPSDIIKSELMPPKPKPEELLADFSGQDLRTPAQRLRETMAESERNLRALDEDTKRRKEETEKLFQRVDEARARYLEVANRVIEYKISLRKEEENKMSSKNTQTSTMSPIRFVSIEPNPQMGVNRGFKGLTESNTKSITTKSHSPIPHFRGSATQFYSIDNDNRRAAQNPQTGINPRMGNIARQSIAPLTTGQAASLNGRAKTGTTAGKLGGSVIGSDSSYRTASGSTYRSTSSMSTSSEASSEAPSRGSTTGSEYPRTIGVPHLGRYHEIPGLGFEKTGGLYLDTQQYRPHTTDPYRIQSYIGSFYDFTDQPRVRRAPKVEKQRVIKTDPFTGRAYEEYVTTATYGGGEEGVLATHPEEHKSIAVVHPLIGEKPRLVKGTKATHKETPLPPAKSSAVVRKSGLKPDKKYKF